MHLKNMNTRDIVGLPNGIAVIASIRARGLPRHSVARPVVGVSNGVAPVAM